MRGTEITMAERAHKPRRTHRVPVPCPLPTHLNGRLEATVLDLSLLGVQIEHRDLVRPGQAYTLNVHLPGTRTPVHLAARAVWSWVHRFEPGEDGAIVVYRTGLEFHALVPGATQTLARFLEDLEKSGQDHRLAAEAGTGN